VNKVSSLLSLSPLTTLSSGLSLSFMHPLYRFVFRSFTASFILVISVSPHATSSIPLTTRLWYSYIQSFVKLWCKILFPFYRRLAVMLC
jgi:hypothetical protein